jgi:hypothetical protein
MATALTRVSRTLTAARYQGNVARGSRRSARPSNRRDPCTASSAAARPTSPPLQMPERPTQRRTVRRGRTLPSRAAPPAVEARTRSFVADTRRPACRSAHFVGQNWRVRRLRGGVLSWLAFATLVGACGRIGYDPLSVEDGGPGVTEGGGVPGRERFAAPHGTSQEPRAASWRLILISTIESGPHVAMTPFSASEVRRPRSRGLVELAS